MAHYQRCQQWRKDKTQSHGLLMEFSNSCYYKRTRAKYLSFLLAFLLFCNFTFSPYHFTTFSIFSVYSEKVLIVDHPPSITPPDSSIPDDAENDFIMDHPPSITPPDSSIPDGTIRCNRSSIRSDICFVKGDVRTESSTSSIFLYSSRNPFLSATGEEEDTEVKLQQEKLKPYTRKWETSVMDTISELNIESRKENSNDQKKCDVRYSVPAIFFSTGGYTGNLYHEFNDGIIPLYITSQHLSKKVVFVIVEYHQWWISKYGDILSHLSDYPPINFYGDNRTHCFPEAIVGLKIHGELAIDPSLMTSNKKMLDFRNLLDQAYLPRIRTLLREETEEETHSKKPKLVILSRNGSRAITNEIELVKMAQEMGFFVRVLSPGPSTELAKIYAVLNSSDVMVGVHGAAMTHFLFLRPGCVFIQVIPLGTQWPAETYYGAPARRLGLNYIGYEILPPESSLSDKYDPNDPVLRNPDSVTIKGWQYTKKIYLDHQNVRLNLDRFQKRLARSYYYSAAAMRRSGSR